MTTPDKLDIMQAFLDTSKWATEMFDVINSDKPAPYRTMIQELNNVIKALEHAREALISDYVLSGEASGDFLAQVRAGLKEPDPDTMVTKPRKPRQAGKKKYS